MLIMWVLGTLRDTTYLAPKLCCEVLFSQQTTFHHLLIDSTSLSVCLIHCYLVCQRMLTDQFVTSSIYFIWENCEINDNGLTSDVWQRVNILKQILGIIHCSWLRLMFGKFSCQVCLEDGQHCWVISLQFY